MSKHRTVAQALATAGVVGTVTDTEHLSDVVVLAKVVDMETGTVRLGVYQSVNTDWITVIGLLESANRVQASVRDVSEDEG